MASIQEEILKTPPAGAKMETIKEVAKLKLKTDLLKTFGGKKLPLSNHIKENELHFKSLTIQQNK